MVALILPYAMAVLLTTICTVLFFKGAGGDEPLYKPRDLQARRGRR